MSTELDLQIRRDLVSRRGEWQQIAEAAEVSHSWISQFVREKIPNPGFTTLKKIRAALDAGGSAKPRKQKAPA